MVNKQLQYTYCPISHEVEATRPTALLIIMNMFDGVSGNSVWFMITLLLGY